jgi:hypothetical protein
LFGDGDYPLLHLQPEGIDMSIVLVILLVLLIVVLVRGL